MDTHFYKLVVSKAKSDGLRSFAQMMLERCADYDRLKETNLQLRMRNRAVREGISLQEIEREAATGARRFKLGQEQSQALQVSLTEMLGESPEDRTLLEMAAVVEDSHRRNVDIHLADRTLPPEDRLILQSELNLLLENRRLITEFARANGWLI